jgi:hypothetical protein
MLRPDDSMVAALEDIVQLLRAYRLDPLTEYVARLLDQYLTNAESFHEAVLANEIWGGAGSLCDVYLPAVAPDSPSAREDDRHLRIAIVRLGESLVAAGIADSRVDERLRVFRDS